MTVALPDEADRWTDLLREELNGREAFAEATAGFEATFRLEILPDETYPGDPIALTVVVADGACPAARAGDREADYDFALRGPYSAWKDLLEDRVDVAAAVMGGTFELEGSTMKLMQRRDAVAELVRAAQTIETTYAY